MFLCQINNIAPIVCGCSVFGPYFVMRSFLVLQIIFDEEERAGYFALIDLLMSCDCKCSVAALPHRTVGWYVVSDCGISWSYSLTVKCLLCVRN